MTRGVLILCIPLMLAQCDDSGARSGGRREESSRVEKEVARRMQIAEHKFETRTATLHTIRVIGWIVLVGGAVAGLLMVRSLRLSATPTAVTLHRSPDWLDHSPPANRRRIDVEPVPDNQPLPVQPSSTPTKRRRRRRNPNAHRHETPGRP